MYIYDVCMYVYEENSMYHFPSDLEVAHGIFIMRRVGEHRLNRCEGTLRMTVWPKQLIRRSISMGNIQLYHANIQATAAVLHRNTVSSKKQQLRENSRDAYGIHPVLKCFMACHTYTGEMETHISYRLLSLAVYFYTLSSVPSETQMLTVYTALKYQFPGSFSDCARIPFCNICNCWWLIPYHVFCKIIWSLSFDCV